MALFGSGTEIPQFLHVGAGEDRFDAALIDDYLSQTSDLIQAAERLVLKLESESGTLEDVRELFRIMHTIKGDSASVALSEFVKLVHAAEEYLQTFSTNARPLSAISSSVLLEVIDALETLVNNLRERSKVLQGRTDAPRYLSLGLKPLIGKLIELSGE